MVRDFYKKTKASQDFFDGLMDELSNYKNKTSPYYRHLSLSDILKEAHGYKIKKDNIRKQVIFIKTSIGNYFIKRSFLVRRKDRLRNFLLPGRRWAEWRNFHKLNALDVDSAKPIIRGQNFNQNQKSFFIITKEVEGKSLNSDMQPDAVIMAEFFADLHKKGIYYADLHPENLIIQPNGRPALIDVQEIFSLKKIPKWLRSYNLGKLYLSLKSKLNQSWFEEFLQTYNRKFSNNIDFHEVKKASEKHYQKHLKSRTKRCLKNSTEFEVLKSKGQKIFKRKDFEWETKDIMHALKNGINLKGKKVIAYENLCIKIHEKRRFHKDRCLASWINSRALDIRGIEVPKALGYFKFNNKSYFICDYLKGGIPLYKYLPTITEQKNKRKIIKQLALWVRKIHHHEIWQKDFNSTNILYYKDQFILLDLDNIRCGNLPEEKKIYNLGQLNASIADAINIKDRIRFFNYYFHDELPSRQKRRSIYNKIWEITLTKNTLVFGLDTSSANCFRIPE
ncbi:MAG: lipopolysaccharide kinase InaA family protein [Desulfobacterales bacterium]|jgi:tRNA A-37 threonylcarbamoyl transferase component Bud32